MLEELAVFLSVWRSVTPNLQVVEAWLTRIYARRPEYCALFTLKLEGGVDLGVAKDN